MNPLLSKITPNLRRHTLSAIRNFYYRRRVQEGCECPEPCKDKLEIIEEKKCTPCSFETWKPKPRKVIENQIKEATKPKLPRKCYAGMLLNKPPPDCKYDDIDPFKNKCCLHQKKTEEKVVSTHKKEKEIPYADWDTECK